MQISLPGVISRVQTCLFVRTELLHMVTTSDQRAASASLVKKKEEKVIRWRNAAQLSAPPAFRSARSLR